MLLFALLWLACVALVHGLTFAYLQRAYPALARGDVWLDFWYALKMSVGGPFALLSFLLTRTCRHGLKFLP